MLEEQNWITVIRVKHTAEILELQKKVTTIYKYINGIMKKNIRERKYVEYD